MIGVERKEIQDYFFRKFKEKTMSINVLEITSRKLKKKKSGFEHFDHFLDNFSTKLVGTANADIVITNPNISLYTFDFESKNAVFVEIDDAYKLNYAAFFSDYQYEHAKKIYLVPFNLMRQLAVLIPKSPIDKTVIGFTARSGSTLLCRAISQIKNVFVISEPISLTFIARSFDMQTNHSKALFEISVLFLANFAANNGACQLVFKPTMMNLENFDNASGQFCKKIFITRNPYEVTQSLLQRIPLFQRLLLNWLPHPIVHWKLLNFTPAQLKIQFKANFQGRNINVNMLAAYIWWLFPFENMMAMLHSPNKNKIISIHYDDLIAEQKDTMKRIACHLDASDSSLDNALREFSKDSQRGTVLSRKNKHTLSSSEIAKIKKDVAIFLSKYYCFDENYRFPAEHKISGVKS